MHSIKHSPTSKECRTSSKEKNSASKTTKGIRKANYHPAWLTSYKLVCFAPRPVRLWSWDLLFHKLLLSLHTKLIFHVLAPRPLSTRLGAFFYPKHSPVKNLRKFFQPKVGELFSIFMVRKIMGVKGSCRSANRGGCPFLYALSV